MRRCLEETRPQLPVPSLMGSQGNAAPPAKSCDNTSEVLSTRDAYKRLGAQGFPWGPVMWAPSAWHVWTFSMPKRKQMFHINKVDDDTERG